MSDTYTKLFSSITESTIWSEPAGTRLVWITMLAKANRHGEVFGAVPGIARLANVTLDEAQCAIETLLAPDQWSRTPDNEGRRIAPIDGGWRLLNFAKFDAMRSASESAERRRQSKLDWDREHRNDRPNAAYRNKITPDLPPTTPDAPPTHPRQPPSESVHPVAVTPTAEAKPLSVENLSPVDSRALATQPPERLPEAEAEQPRERPAPTPAGAACLAMLAAGIHRANPHDPRLLELIGAGASTDQFRAAAADAVSRGKPNQGYALGIVRGQMTEAAQIRGSPTPLAKPIPRGMEGVVALEELKTKIMEERRAKRLAADGDSGGNAAPGLAAISQRAGDG